jgi:hypothetical protein
LSTADDSVLEGFSTIFTSSPSLHKETLEMNLDKHAIVVPAWSPPRDPRADGNDAVCDANCGDDAVDSLNNHAPAFFFDYHDPSLNPMDGSQTSFDHKLSVCFPNEHAPHPIEQLQPCLDTQARAVVLLRLPLHVVHAVSLVNDSGSEMQRAGKEALAQAEGHCLSASAAVMQNGAYM